MLSSNEQTKPSQTFANPRFSRFYIVFSFISLNYFNIFLHSSLSHSLVNALQSNFFSGRTIYGIRCSLSILTSFFSLRMFVTSWSNFFKKNKRREEKLNKF